MIRMRAPRMPPTMAAMLVFGPEEEVLGDEEEGLVLVWLGRKRRGRFGGCR